MRIKGDDGAFASGTIRVKEGEDFGTFRYNGTVRACSGSQSSELPEWMRTYDPEGTGTVRFNKDDIDAAFTGGSVRIYGENADDDFPAFLKFSYIYITNFCVNDISAPEDWEVNILALEKGEWTPDMDNNADAFRKYKKERRSLGSLFSGPPDPSTSSSTGASSQDKDNEDSSVETRNKTLSRGKSKKRFSDNTTPSPATKSKKVTKKQQKKEIDALKKALRKKK